MATIAATNKSNSGRYGAPELKQYIKTSTWRSFLGALGLFALIIGGYVISQSVANADDVKFMAPPVKLKLSQLPPPPSANDAPPPMPPPPSEVVIASGPAARAGTPVPVPDAMIPEDIQDFANVDEIARATAEGGDEDFSGFGDNEGFGEVQLDIAPEVVEEPDAFEFIPVEKEPYIDLGDLQRKVKYPPIAQRAGLEGSVVIRVLIDVDGKPKKHIVQQSDNEVFNEAAVAAVMSSVFTPAIQNQQPIQCWVSIPITFKLRN